MPDCKYKNTRKYLTMMTSINLTHTYSATRDGNTIQRSDGAFIPKDPANMDYAAYLTWQKNGGVITPYSEPPMTFTQFQAQAKDALAATDPVVAQITEAVALGDTTLSAPDVIAYMQYRRALRVIIIAPADNPNNIAMVLPVQPAIPANI
jgi:hypothetical protein